MQRIGLSLVMILMALALSLSATSLYADELWRSSSITVIEEPSGGPVTGACKTVVKRLSPNQAYYLRMTILFDDHDGPSPTAHIIGESEFSIGSGTKEFSEESPGSYNINARFKGSALAVDLAGTWYGTVTPGDNLLCRFNIWEQPNYTAPLQRHEVRFQLNGD